MYWALCIFAQTILKWSKMSNYKSGFIAIVGRPNAGKSTLLNALLKEKIAIMSAQTEYDKKTIFRVF